MPCARRCARRQAVAIACCASTGTACAAGGHFAVDDAAVLDPGQCQVETWLERHPSAGTLTHVGPACRVGAVELGLDADRFSGVGSTTVVGPQLKWAGAIDERTSVGAVALAGWSGRAPRYATSALYAIATVRFGEDVWLHVNGGRDWYAERSPTSRAGASVEWHALPAWTMIAEAFRQSTVSAARIGVRWEPNAALSIDLSCASPSGALPGPWWALGVSWTFARPSR